MVQATDAILESDHNTVPSTQSPCLDTLGPTLKSFMFDSWCVAKISLWYLYYLLTQWFSKKNFPPDYVRFISIIHPFERNTKFKFREWEPEAAMRETRLLLESSINSVQWKALPLIRMFRMTKSGRTLQEKEGGRIKETKSSRKLSESKF